MSPKQWYENPEHLAQFEKVKPLLLEAARDPHFAITLFLTLAKILHDLVPEKIILHSSSIDPIVGQRLLNIVKRANRVGQTIYNERERARIELESKS